MTIKDLYTRCTFQLWTVAPFGLFLLVVLFLYACEQKPAEEPPKFTITNENLQTAYAKSVRHRYMYSKFIAQAKKEKLAATAKMYAAIARSEDIHAANHAALMHSRNVEPKTPQIDSVAVGTIVQTLKMALSSEDIESESMYPNLIRTANAEKDSVAQAQFQRTMEADVRQAELMKDAADHAGKVTATDFFVCPGCGYIITSSETQECPVCHGTKAAFERI